MSKRIFFLTSRKNGFTLAEVLVVIFITSLLMLGVTAIIVFVFRNYREQIQALGNVYQLTLVSLRFANELRNASTGNDGSYAINQAAAQQFIFYSSYGATGPVVDRIRYFLSGTTLYKGIVAPTGSPLSYKLASETVLPVQAYVANGSSPVFYYYDGNYGGTTSPMVQPVNVNNVKYVTINLSVITNPEVSSSTYPFVVGATLRNLKNNLGN